MKKNFFILLLLLVFSSCSESVDELDLLNNGSSTEKKLTLLESEVFDPNSGILTKIGVGFYEEGKLTTFLNYDSSQNLTEKTIYEYNQEKLLSSVSYFDEQGNSLIDKNYTINYDNQNRISEISELNYTRTFTYNIDNSITTTLTELGTTNIYTIQYYLNQNNKVYRFVSNSSDAEFDYVDNELVSGLYSLGNSTQVTVNYTYEYALSSKGYSFKKSMIEMYGSTTNAILASQSSIVNNLSMFYEDYAVGFRHYIPSQSFELVNTFEYIRDSENYLMEYNLISNNGLYNNVKFTYED